MRKINEIFYSIQGEGFYTGTPAVFIRFAGCNLNCPFCDTSHEDGQFMSDEEILNEVKKYPATHIILTGGEPSLQIDESFVDMLRRQNAYSGVVQIETNGTNPLPERIDFVTVSPKQGKILKINQADELKVVYTGQDLMQYDDFKAKYRYLQPCSGKNINEVIEYVKNNPTWNISVQMHKLLNIP